MRESEPLRLDQGEVDTARPHWPPPEPAAAAALAEPVAAAALPVATGRVKWFDAARGFGFLVSDDCEGDILLHFNLLAPHGRKSLPEGTMVTVKVGHGKRGRMAAEILSYDLATAIHADADRQPTRLNPADFLQTAADLAAVQVRWFNRSKGYGFLLGSDGVTEIFIHMETVRRGGFETLNPGQLLLARVADGPRGQLAVLISPQAPIDA